jgi:hypothetical protein
VALIEWMKQALYLLFILLGSFMALSGEPSATQPDGPLEIHYGILRNSDSGEIIAVTNTYQPITYWGDSYILGQTPAWQSWFLYRHDGEFIGSVGFDAIPVDAEVDWNGDQLNVNIDGLGFNAVPLSKFTRFRSFPLFHEEEESGYVVNRYSGDLWIRWGGNFWEVRQWPELNILAKFKHDLPWLWEGARTRIRIGDDGRLLVHSDNQLWAIDVLTGVGEHIGMIPYGGLSELMDNGWTLALSTYDLILLDEEGRVLDSLDRVSNPYGQVLGGFDPINKGLGTGAFLFPMSGSDSYLVEVQPSGQLNVVPDQTIRLQVRDTAQPYLRDWWIRTESEGDGRRYVVYHYLSMTPVLEVVDTGNPKVFGPQTGGVRKGPWDIIILNYQHLFLNRESPGDSFVQPIPDTVPMGDYSSIEILDTQPAEGDALRAFASYPEDPVTGQQVSEGVLYRRDMTAFETAAPREGILVSPGIGYWAPFGYINQLDGDWFHLPGLGEFHLSQLGETTAFVYSEKLGWAYLDTAIDPWLFYYRENKWIKVAVDADDEIQAFFDPEWRDWDDFEEGLAPTFFSRRQWIIEKAGQPIEHWSLQTDGIAYVHFYDEPEPLFDSAHYAMERTGPSSAKLEFWLDLGDLTMEGSYLFSYTSESTGVVDSEVTAYILGEEVDSVQDSGSFRFLPWGAPAP